MNTAAPPFCCYTHNKPKHTHRPTLGLPTFAPGQRSQYSDLATGWTEPKSLFDSRQGQNILLFSKMIIQGLGPTQPRIQWVMEGTFPGGKESMT